ncbi:MAG: hypothetical protein M3Y72_13125 [Acidobacteriota bacterium]|nr:hypothetical protein [Acidobacteriota bacterium]
MTAKMPLAYIEPAPVPVSQLPVGGTGFIASFGLRVGPDLSTYIPPAAKLRDKTLHTVEVRRGSDGYRVVIHEASLRFRPQEITGQDLIPVIELLEEIEPDHFEQIAVGQKNTRELFNHISGTFDTSRKGIASPEMQPPGALMPASRMQPPVSFLRDLEMDQTGYVEFWGITIDEKTGSTYLRRDARLNPKPHGVNVTVTLRGDGYHLLLHHEWTQFTPMEIRDYSGLIPVVEVSEGPGRKRRP